MSVGCHVMTSAAISAGAFRPDDLKPPGLIMPGVWIRGHREWNT